MFAPVAIERNCDQSLDFFVVVDRFAFTSLKEKLQLLLVSPAKSMVHLETPLKLFIVQLLRNYVNKLHLQPERQKTQCSMCT